MLIFGRMKTLEDVDAESELLQWITTCRRWKEALWKRSSVNSLVRLSRIRGRDTKKKSVAVLAEAIIRAIEKLKTAGEPPAKIHKTVRAPSLATPKPTRHTSRSRSARRGGGAMMDESAATRARSFHVAEALAMSTRKSDAAGSKVTSLDLIRRLVHTMSIRWFLRRLWAPEHTSKHWLER